MRRLFGILIASVFTLAIITTVACTRPSDNPNNQTSTPTNSANQPKDNGGNPSTTPSTTPSAPATNPSLGAIKVGSRPTGASIMLIADEGGEAGKPQLRGTSPAIIADLPPGKYTVHLELKGYKYFQKAVEVKAGETVTVTTDLQKQ